MRLGCDTEDGPGSDGHRDPRLTHMRYKQHGNTREKEDGEQEKEANVMMVTRAGQVWPGVTSVTRSRDADTD